MRPLLSVVRLLALPVVLGLAGCASEGGHDTEHSAEGGHGKGHKMVHDGTYTSSMTDGRPRTIRLTLYEHGLYVQRLRVNNESNVPVVVSGTWTETDSTLTLQTHLVDGEELPTGYQVTFARADNGDLQAVVINGDSLANGYTLAKQ